MLSETRSLFQCGVDPSAVEAGIGRLRAGVQKMDTDNRRGCSLPYGSSIKNSEELNLVRLISNRVHKSDMNDPSDVVLEAIAPVSSR
jgi:hypothetical protein